MRDKRMMILVSLGNYEWQAMAAMAHVSKTGLEKSCRSLQAKMHQIGVFTADVDLCPKQSRTRAAKIGNA